MGLVEALVILVVGYLTGTVTRLFAGIAAIIALVLAILGFAAPASVYDLVDPVLAFYRGNELLFLAGFLFAIDHHRD